MSIELKSMAENRARAAESLEPFGGLNLLHVKRQVYELLRHIGEHGMFDTYTRHDSQHIESMLAMCDWIIPADTAKAMTDADWLLIVLSIYLHDLGMLVTKEEFEKRELSPAFTAFRHSRLKPTDDAGKDYAEKLSALAPEEVERFLYQEFVRENHAERIRMWLDSPHSSRLGEAQSVAKEVSDLLAPLDDVFKADLGIVCESHHRNDLDNINKYPVRRPYGTSPAEVANVQYAAIVLRTVDLLQITRDRTPSITFRALTPSDPVSQREWAKQMAVRAILPQPKVDRDGNVDHTLQPSAVEVHARFTDENGFFALTSYLAYARSELEQSFKWVAESNKRHGTGHAFPWRDIDESNISTQGFLPSQFEFHIDQTRVLDLLTGHTLYNDSSVVLRELVQNAIDAVRLQRHLTPSPEEFTPVVEVRWNSAERVLEVQDNGTGMTQEIIEQNFLRVGASRYQDPAFKRDNPTFSPISRFGIGVLSTFMIADSVEVLTCHPDDNEGRQISLRSVHGKYLIRLLDKEEHPELRKLARHGTLVRLRVRASAGLKDVLALARSWFVIPGCRLTVVIDDDEPVEVGSASTSEALVKALASLEVIKDHPVEVREYQAAGLSLAYAVRWSPYAKRWDFVYLERSSPQLEACIGTCIEGVRVDTRSPGFPRAHVLALANSCGPNSPRTNVARSSIEHTAEYEELTAGVYRGFLSHVIGESEALVSERGYSPTRSSADARWMIERLAYGFSSPDERARKAQLDCTVWPAAFLSEVRTVPLIVIEEHAERHLLTTDELSTRDSIHTINDLRTGGAERLIEQLPVNMSLSKLNASISGLDLVLPTGPTIFGTRRELVASLIRQDWDVDEIEVNPDRPSVLLSWGLRGHSPRWLVFAPDDPGARQLVPEFAVGGMRSVSLVAVPLARCGTKACDSYNAVADESVVYLLPDRPWQKLLGISSIDEISTKSRWEIMAAAITTIAVTYAYSRGPLVQDHVLGRITKRADESRNRLPFTAEKLRDVLQEGPWDLFDLTAWTRSYL